MDLQVFLFVSFSLCPYFVNSDVLVIHYDEEMKEVLAELNISDPTSDEKRFASKIVDERIEKKKEKENYRIEKENHLTEKKNLTEKISTKDKELGNLQGENSRLQAIILEIGVVQFMRYSLDSFIDRCCNSVKKIRKSVGLYSAPPKDDLPLEIQDDLMEAKEPFQIQKVETHLKTYNYKFQQTKAILKKSNKTDEGIIIFRAIFDNSTKGLTRDEADDYIARAIAYLNYRLSKNIHGEDFSRKIKWTDKEAVLNALKECGITQTNALEAAAAIHEFRVNPVFMGQVDAKKLILDEPQ